MCMCHCPVSADFPHYICSVIFNQKHPLKLASQADECILFQRDIFQSLAELTDCSSGGIGSSINWKVGGSISGCKSLQAKYPWAKY